MLIQTAKTRFVVSFDGSQVSVGPAIYDIVADFITASTTFLGRFDMVCDVLVTSLKLHVANGLRINTTSCIRSVTPAFEVRLLLSEQTFVSNCC